MTTVARFVDSIAASPTLRFDFNTALVRLERNSVNFSPPPLKTRNGETLLRDGSPIPASAYANRVLVFSVIFNHTTEALRASALNTLNKELDRARNIFQWQPDGATDPVFFRTFRSPDYDKQVKVDAKGAWRLTLRLRAEPFAYGQRVTQAAATVYADPAAGSNGRYFDITGVTGDVITPLHLKLSDIDQYNTVLATRRHGVVADVEHFQQSEHATLLPIADSTLQPNNPTYSGAADNSIYTTFATTAAMATRYGFEWPALIPADAWRGTYRVFVRVKRSSATGEVNLRILANGAQLDGTTRNMVDPHLVDMGLLALPTSADVTEDGYSGVALPPEAVLLLMQAERVSGTAVLAWDYVLFIPADENHAAIGWSVAASGIGVFDGPQDTCYILDSTGTLVQSAGGSPPLSRAGGVLHVAPGITNRVYVVATSEGGQDTLGDTHTVTASWWPRYLYVR